MSEEALARILEEGDNEGCVAFFRGMPEKERRGYAAFCLDWLRKVRKDEFQEKSPGVFTRNPLLDAAQTAVFATASLSELRKLGWASRPQTDEVEQLLLDRRPPWTGEWALGLLEEQYYWAHWTLIRRLMAAGMMEKPEHPNYYLGMISGILGPGGLYKNHASIEERLLEDPDLLQDEVWRLFEFDGGGENSLANWDRFGRGQTWQAALLSLERKVLLSRERLLQCSLEALERDFNHYRAKWFSAFHDALSPSAEEQAEHAERYLRLLAVSAPSIASWAFGQVEKLEKQGAYDAPSLLAGLKPLLGSRQKGIVKKALKLAEKTAKQSPAAARDAALAATTALGHEAADVQKAALDLIDRIGTEDDDELRAAVAPYADLAAPSLRSRFDRWTPAAARDEAGESSPPAAADVNARAKDLDPTLRKLFRIDAMQSALKDGRVETPAAAFDGTEIPRLAPLERLTPIEELDELIDVCARVIEDETQVDDAERAIDGLSRLCDRKPDDFAQRIGPLLKRATHRLKKDAAPFLGMGPGDDLCGLIYAWGAGHVIEGKRDKESGHRVYAFEFEGQKRTWFVRNLQKAVGILSRRSLAVARRAAEGKAAPLLSAPTHAGGWIDPAELVRRVNAWTGGDPDVTDVYLALLRTAPDGRDAALAKLKAKPAEWSQAIAYGLSGKKIKLGKDPALWSAAARCRSPWSDDDRVAKAFPDLGPDAGRAAAYAYRCRTDSRGHTHLSIETKPAPPKSPPENCVTVVMHAQRGTGADLRWEMGGAAGRTVGSVRWTATIWPAARESFFAAAAHDMADNLDWWEAQWQNKALLEPLLDPGTPLREMGLLLLAIVLAAKEPGERGLATDAAIRAIDDGRLGGDNLGEIMGTLLPTGLVKPGRWANSLADIARISPAHALVVQQGLQRSLRGDPTKMPRDYAKLVDLLKELSIDLGQSVADEGCRTFLESLPRAGKAGKAAQALLSLASDAAAGARLMQQVLEQRIAAAGRFAAAP